MAAIIKHLVDDKDMVLIPKLIFEKKNRRDTKLRDAMHRVYRHLQNNLVVSSCPTVMAQSGVHCLIVIYILIFKFRQFL